MTNSSRILRQSIRTIADYPKPGIQFRDITTLLRDARAFEITIDALERTLARRSGSTRSPASRRAASFSAAPWRHASRCGFVPIRKRGKLPHETVRVAYSLEYGVDEMEMHKDAIEPASACCCIDDLIATGGTATAAAQLAEDPPARTCVSACFVIDLPGLGGAARLRAAGIAVQALLTF